MEKTVTIENRKYPNYLIYLMPIVYLLISVAVVLIVCKNGIYPSGSDTMYHIYRGDLVYRSIQSGNWYPLYDAMWYNGVELMRYWAPLPAYFMAFCQMMAGGEPLNGYLIFVGLVCFLGALPWLWIGKKTERPWLGAFLGALWFFMPNNLTALFVEGNLARSLSMVFLPLLIYSCMTYLEKRSWNCIPLMMISFMLMILCHLGYAGMVALTLLLYILVKLILTGKGKGTGDLIITMVLALAVLGFWVYPSLRGGLTSMDNSENMKNFFQSILISINPLERLESNNSNFYFGLAALLIAVFGGFFSEKKCISGFWTGVLILLSTTSTMYYVLKLLPGSQYLWMLRFISIALCMILMSFLFWDRLKKPLVLLLAALLVADTIPSLSLVYGLRSGAFAEERLNSQQEYTLIKEAQEITEQRMALMDVSSMGSTGAWLVSRWNDGVPATFGAGWEAANTSSNIAQMNRSIDSGKYRYLFDRSKELGNDTVLVQMNRLCKTKTEEENKEALAEAAEALGYTLVDDSGDFRLYHLKDAYGNWGTVNKYRAIGIGTAAPSISLDFPVMEETTSTKLDDYTFEELSEYDLVYLAGFTYDDRDYAEDLVLRLSEAGVHIVIAADGIPEDRKTHDQSFLGVVCNPITFSNGYPELDTIEGLFNTDLFPEGYEEWNTVYLEGLDDCWGKVWDNGLELPFYGTVKNENIVMIGINLTYFYGLTEDPTVGLLLEHAMDLSSQELPQREIVPLDIEISDREIEIKSEKDNVNTTLAYHDIFKSGQPIEPRNHLTYVNGGTTKINLVYPYMATGLVISAVGLLLSILYLISMRKQLKEKE